MKRILGVAAVAAAVVLSACLHTAGPLDLDLTATASPTSVAVGDTVTFVSDSQGDALLLIDIAYGDGATEAVDLPGARTAHNTFKHVYGAVGTYNAAISVVQADSAARSTAMTITVH